MLLTLVVVVLALPVCAADMPTEARGGKPPAGSRPSVENFAAQVTSQRSFEEVVWSMPAMIKYGMRWDSIEIGGGDNVVLALSASFNTPLLDLGVSCFWDTDVTERLSTGVRMKFSVCFVTI